MESPSRPWQTSGTNMGDWFVRWLVGCLRTVQWVQWVEVEVENRKTGNSVWRKGGSAGLPNPPPITSLETAGRFTAIVATINGLSSKDIYLFPSSCNLRPITPLEKEYGVAQCNKYNATNPITPLKTAGCLYGTMCGVALQIEKEEGSTTCKQEENWRTVSSCAIMGQ